MALNEGQSEALDKMKKFLRQGKDHFFLLSGAAGTGKTFCMQQLMEQTRGRLIFTAPTNKATKVLKSLLKSQEYTPECRTIYSLLGLRLTTSGEIKELAEPEEPVDLSKYLAIVIDEASMISSKLWRFLVDAAEEQNLLVILLGDRYQIPPVGETFSPIWGLKSEWRAELTEVRRHGGVILEQVTAIREQIDHPAPTFRRYPGQRDGKGVWECRPADFHKRILEMASAGAFSTPEHVKAVAWRNVTVDSLNHAVRGRIFENASTEFWLPGDRLTLREPAHEFGEENGKLGTTDDEGTVNAVEVVRHPIHGEFHTWRLSLTMDDNRTIALHALHDMDLPAYQRKVEELSIAARSAPRKWKDFWEFKEDFHQVRHAYATTAHRSQGSTYKSAFVDWRDILLNRNRREAFQCLYVAASRPQSELYFN